MLDVPIDRCFGSENAVLSTVDESSESVFFGVMMEAVCKKGRAVLEVNLIRVTKNGKSTRVPLSHERTLVGRQDDCHIRVPVAGISRKHCEIVIADGSIVINDLGSSNGTYVNQERISGAQPLSAGDLISFGGLVFVVGLQIIQGLFIMNE